MPIICIALQPSRFELGIMSYHSDFICFHKMYVLLLNIKYQRICIKFVVFVVLVMSYRDDFICTKMV